MITRQTELSRRWCTALVGLLWESQFCQLLRFCRGWSDIRVISETGLLCDQVAELHFRVGNVQVPKSFAQLRRGSFGERVWSPRGQIGLIVGPLEAGLEPTPGSKACDEERSGVKRRCKPFNHTAESETAGASSYSSGGGGIIAQPRAVEPDLSGTRGLKREVWMLLTWKSLKSVRSFPMLT